MDAFFSGHVPKPNRAARIHPRDDRRAANGMPQPLWALWGRNRFNLVPRVARSSQPWAGGRNPVGIDVFRSKVKWMKWMHFFQVMFHYQRASANDTTYFGHVSLPNRAARINLPDDRRAANRCKKWGRRPVCQSDS